MLTCMSTGLDRRDAAIEQGATDDPCSHCPYRELRDLARAISQVYEVAFAGRHESGAEKAAQTSPATP